MTNMTKTVYEMHFLHFDILYFVNLSWKSEHRPLRKMG